MSDCQKNVVCFIYHKRYFLFSTPFTNRHITCQTAALIVNLFPHYLSVDNSLYFYAVSLATTSSSIPPPPPPVLGKLVSSTHERMKKLNWEALVPGNLSEGCFWANHRTDGLRADDTDIIDGLTKRFSFPSNNIKIGSAAKSHIKLRVLDKNIAQNILILLRGHFKNSSHNQIKEHILRCDTTFLNSTLIEGLIKSLPQPHEIQKLYEMDNNGTELLDVEKFVASLGNIERLVPRLHCINFKLGFSEIITDLKPNIEAGIAACQEVISSSKFGEIIKLILSIGNFMNSESTIGGVAGFNLAILSKLNNVKSKDHKTTLLHYIAETIECNSPNLLNFGDELVHVGQAANLNVDQINGTIRKLSLSSENLRKELENANVRSNSADDKFAEEMTPVSLQSHDQVDTLSKMMIQMQNDYMKVGKYFAFNIYKCPMNEFFSNIKTFETMFAKAYAEIAKKHAEEGLARCRQDLNVVDREQQNLAFVVKGMYIKGLVKNTFI